MKIITPTPNTIFPIGSAALWPSLPSKPTPTAPRLGLEDRLEDLHQTGTAITADNRWDAQSAIADLGGTLTVTAQSGHGIGNDSDSVSVTLTGANPTVDDANAFLATQANSTGFDKILAKEARFHHFTPTGEPLKSFDNGYGMCQLTTPTPSFAQVWNWKHNIQAGLVLFAAKHAAAVAYLTQSGRTATAQQIEYEAVCRWNGGRYHTWNTHAAAWVRDPNIFCDPATGSLGWDMTDPANTGKTLAQLHQRDSASFNHPPAPGAHWKYSGVCYADRLLG